MKIREENSAVQYVLDPIITLRETDIQQLIEKLPETAQGRIRLCTHQSPSDALHEMMIVLSRNTVIRPHKHEKKVESFHVVYGECEVLLFEDDGRVRETISMGTFASGKCFYYRLMLPLFHTVRITSDYVVLHETTQGPFLAEETVFAEWE